MGLITTLTGKILKLKKKYIGDHMPENRKSNNDSTNNLITYGQHN